MSSTGLSQDLQVGDELRLYLAPWEWVLCRAEAGGLKRVIRRITPKAPSSAYLSDWVCRREAGIQFVAGLNLALTAMGSSLQLELHYYDVDRGIAAWDGKKAFWTTNPNLPETAFVRFIVTGFIQAAL